MSRRVIGSSPGDKPFSLGLGGLDGPIGASYLLDAPPGPVLNREPPGTLRPLLMKDDYIARKERWARKMAGQEKPAVRSDRSPAARPAAGASIFRSSILAFGRKSRSISGS